MKVKTIILMAGLLAIGLCMSFTSFAQPQHDPGHKPAGFWSQLSDEQKSQIRETIQKMHDEGSNPQDVHEAITELLQGWGISVPENADMRGGPRQGNGPQGKGIWLQLTDDRRKQLHEKMQSLQDAGATPEEIHQAVKEMLQGWGIKVPGDWEGPIGFRHFGPPAGDGLLQQLTAEQRKVVFDKIMEMRDAKATHEEIETAVKEMLSGFGLEVPADWHLPAPPGGGILAQLTAAQRLAVHTKVAELRNQNATSAEINSAVKKLLESFGVQVPENWPGLRPPLNRGGFWQQLSEDQRKILREKIQSLREQNATSDEIRHAVDEQLQEWGIEPPEHKGGDAGNRPGDMGQNADQYKSTIEAKNYPNPFNPETNIVYSLPNTQHVLVRIYNSNGQLVATLVNAEQAAGTHTIRWDGKDESGSIITSGVYYYQIAAGANSITKGMIFLK